MNKLFQKSLLLIAASALSLCGCGAVASDDQVSEKAEINNVNLQSDEVTLDWYINFSWFNTKWGDNAVSKEITNKTGVNINFITPLGNEEEKLNSLIASGSLPDLITLGWWEPQVNEMIQGDMVYALNKLADEYDPYFYEVTDPQAISWYTQPDGNVYGYPCSSVTPDDVASNDNIGSNQTLLVRKDIYEAIGSPDMTTTEGFEAAVKKAYEMFPEIDGKPLIPVGAHIFDDTGNVLLTLTFRISWQFPMRRMEDSMTGTLILSTLNGSRCLEDLENRDIFLQIFS